MYTFQSESGAAKGKMLLKIFIYNKKKHNFVNLQPFWPQEASKVHSF